MAKTEVQNEVERLFARWLARTEELHLQEISKMDLIDSGDLEKSVRQYYRKLANGYLEGGLSFDKHGRFLDMGSGRGYSFGKSIRADFDSESSRRKSGRKKRPWYSRVFYARINDLQGAIGFKLMEESLDMAKVGLTGNESGKVRFAL